MHTHWSKTAISTFVKSAMMAGISSSILIPTKVMSAPQGGVISKGNGSIKVDNKTTVVKQSTSSMVVDWQSFNVAKDELVQFEHPSAKAATLNRIHDQKPSQILGSIEGKGSVYLINPNGMVFGENSTVNVGSLVATTKHLSDDDFMSGNIALQDVDNEGLIVNRGLITAATGGAVVLVADNVVNEGVIQAKKGRVVLASGESATLDFAGDGLLKFKLQGATEESASGSDTAVLNAGVIKAEDGSVLLTAKAARDVFANVVNNTGVIEAKGIDTSGGSIRLLGDGGDVRNSGSLIATSDAGIGGKVDLSGDRTAIDSDALIDVSGTAGGGSIRVGGGYQGEDTDLKNSQHTLVASNAVLKANATESGSGGQVIVWADDSTNYQGVITATGKGVGGDGGFAEVSGKEYFQFNGNVDLSAENGVDGTLLLDPKNIRITLNGNAPILNNDSFLENSNGTAEIGAADLVALLDTANVTLQAHVDIDVETEVDASSNTGDVLSTNNLTLEANNDINIDGVITLQEDATLTLISGHEIHQSEAIIATSLVVDGVDVTLDHASNNFDSVTLSSGTNSVDIVDVDDLSISASSVIGNLTVTTAGNLTQTGALTVGDLTVTSGGGVIQTGALTVGGHADIDAAGDITFSNIDNNFNTIELNSINATVVDIDALSLSESTLTGNLIVTTGGDLSQSGSVGVAGATTLTATGFDIDLQDASNDFNSLALDAANAMVVDTSGLSLDTSTLTGNLTVTTGGDLSQIDAVDVAGTATLTATGFDIDLLNASNNFNSLALNGVNATVVDIDDLSLAESTLTGDFVLTTGGDLTQSDQVEVGGNFEINATGNDVDLQHSGNDFTTVDAIASNLHLQDKNDLSVSAVNVNDLTLTSGGVLTQTGAFIVTNNGDVRATTATLMHDNDFNVLAINGDNAEIKDVSGLALAASDLSGNLTLNVGGSLTQSAALSVDGATDITASTVLLTQSNDFNAIGMTTGSATVTDVNALVLNENHLTGNLTLTTGGNLTQAAEVTVTGNTTLLSVGQTIDLSHSNNDFNTLTATADTLSVRDSNDLIMDGLSVDDLTLNVGAALTQTADFIVNNVADITANSALLTQTNDFDTLSIKGGVATINDINALSLSTSELTGDLTITTGGDLTQSGSVEVGGHADLDASGNDIVLQNTSNDFSTLALNGVNASVVDTNELSLAASTLTANLTVTTGGDLTQTGTVDVANATTLTATGSDIDLQNSSNDFNSLALIGANATVVDINELSLADSTLTGNLTVTTGGDLTQTDTLDVAGATALTATGFGIDLQNASNDFNSVALNSANATVVDSNSLSLGASTLTGNLTVTTGGDLTQTDTLDVAGATTLTATASDIDLQNASNDFNSLALNGANATVVDINELSLADSSLTGHLTVTTGGHLTQTDTLDVTGATTLTATGFDIDLQNAGNDFNSLALHSANAAVVDTNELMLGSSTLTGNLTVTTGGDLTQIGAVGVTGTAILTATSADIDLQNASNDFTSLALNGANASVVDVNEISLASSTLMGNLTVTTGGNLTQTDTLDVEGATAFTATGFDIDLQNASNDFNSLALNAVNATVVDTNELSLDSSTLTGNLTVTAGGDLTQTGALDVVGIAALTATGSDIDLQNVNNDFNTLTLMSDSAYIADSNDLVLDGLNVENLTVAVTGALTQLGAYVVTAAADITANSALLTQANDFNELSINGGVATVNDINALSLSTSNLTGDLTITAAGDLTQSGSVAVGGHLSINASGNDIDLQHAGNDFSTVTALANNLHLQDQNDLSVSGVSVNDLTLNVGGALTQTGAFIVTNDGDIRATTATLTLDNDFKTLAINGSNVAVKDVSGLELGASELDGNLTLNVAGTLTQSGTVSVDGTSDITAAVVQLADDNDFNELGLITGNAIVTDVNGLVLNESHLTGDLTLTTGGALTQTEGVSVVGNTTLLSVGHSIDLSNSSNDFNTLTAITTSLSVSDSNDVIMDGLSVEDLTLTVAGTLTQVADFVVDNLADITAHSALLTQANDFNELSINGGAATVNDINSLSLSASELTGDLTVTTGGDLTQSGSLVVGGHADLNVSGHDINLQNATNDFTTVDVAADNVHLRDTNDLSVAGLSVTDLTLNAGGALTQTGAFVVTGSGDVRASTTTLTQDNNFNTLAVNGGSAEVKDINGLVLDASNLSGNLTLDVAGALSQTAAVNVDGTTNITASTVLLTESNDFNTLGLTTGSATLIESNALALETSSITGDLTLIVGGDLTQNGALTVTGDATLSATGHSIDLQNAGNDFNSLSVSASDLSVNDINDLVIDGLNVDDLAISIAGALTQTNAFTVSNVADITANTVDLTLSNDFNQITISAASADIVEQNDIDLLTQTITGELSVSAEGDITQSAALSFADTATFNSVNGDVVLDSVANDFATLNVSGNEVTVNDQNNLVLNDVYAENLTIDIDGDLTQTDTVSVTGQTQLTASTIVLDLLNSFNEIGFGAGNTTVVDTDAIVITDSVVTGDLSLTTGGDLTQTGSLVVSGSTTIDAIGSTVDLQNSANDFSTVNVAADNIHLRDTNDLSVSALTTTDLTLTAGGALAQTGAFVVANLSDLTADTMALNQANDFNHIGLSGNSADITDLNGLSISASSLSGDLSINASGGLVQSGALIVAGHTDLTASSIELENSTNDFNTLSVAASAVGVRDLNDLSISGLSVDELSIHTDGTLSQTGAFVVANHTDLNVANSILNLANDFNTLSVNADSVEINDLNDFTLSTSVITGTASLQLGGDLTQVGSLRAEDVEVDAAGYSVSLNHVNNAIGSVALVAEEATIVNSDGLTIEESTIGQRLDVTAGGDVTQTAALNISNLTVNAAGHVVTLNNINNDFDTLSVSAEDVDVVDVDGVTLSGGTVTDSYALQVGGTVDQSAAIWVNALSIDAVAQAVLLDNGNNELSSLQIQADTVTLSERSGLSLRDTVIQNSLTLNVAGDITQSGILMVPDLFINAGSNNVTLGNTSNQIDHLAVEAGRVILNNQSDLELGQVAADQLTIVTANNVTQEAGSKIKVTDQLSLSANSIQLTENNDIYSVELLGGGDATVNNIANLQLGNIDLANLTLTVTGDISNTAASNISVSNAFTATNSGNIELGTVAGDSVDFGSVRLNSRNVTLYQDSHILLKDTQATSLKLKSTGNVEDDGDLKISGAFTVDARGDINLGSFGSSEVTRFGSISLKAANIRVIEEDSMMIHRAEGDVVELFSEAGSINTNGTTIVADSVLTLSAGPNKDIGDPANLVDFTLDTSGTLTLDARTAYLSQSAADLSKQVALFSSNALIRSESHLAALTRSEIEFLSYLLGVDEALFNEFVTIFDVRDEGILLPEDQREEELSWLSDDGRFLVSVSKDERFKHYYDIWKTYGQVFAHVSVNDQSIKSGWL